MSTSSLTVNELKNKRKKAIVAYTKFSVAITNPDFKNDLFCFFEGKDNPYYTARIKNNCNKIIYPITCGGREKVLKVHKLITEKTEYDTYHKAFFIDKDFNNDNFNSRLIYQTHCYAIENLYVNSECFSEILTHQFRIDKNSAEFNKLIQLFADRLADFNQSMLFFNAWYSCLIDIRNNDGTQTGVQLDEKPPKSFISICLDAVTHDYDLVRINQEFNKALSVTESDVDQKIIEFQSTNLEDVLRGKYQLHFLLQFIELIIADSKSKNKQYTTTKISHDFDGNFNQQRALTVFSDCAKTPTCLIDFLSNLNQCSNI